jgi:hypothetical protein
LKHEEATGDYTEHEVWYFYSGGQVRVSGEVVAQQRYKYITDTERLHLNVSAPRSPNEKFFALSRNPLSSITSET